MITQIQKMPHIYLAIDSSLMSFNRLATKAV